MLISGMDEPGRERRGKAGHGSSARQGNHKPLGFGQKFSPL
jgi:hypothetical protein